jgi:hypothetical protein
MQGLDTNEKLKVQEMAKGVGIQFCMVFSICSILKLRKRFAPIQTTTTEEKN